jgi:hypothetical protein
MDTTRNSPDDLQPVRDGDTTIDLENDPAQAEWEGTDVSDVATATGDDPAQIPSDDDDIPAEDLPGHVAQPETQGDDPVIAELGEEGQGDLAPEDL